MIRNPSLHLLPSLPLFPSFLVLRPIVTRSYAYHYCPQLSPSLGGIVLFFFSRLRQSTFYIGVVYEPKRYLESARLVRGVGSARDGVSEPRSSWRGPAQAKLRKDAGSRPVSVVHEPSRLEGSSRAAVSNPTSPLLPRAEPARAP